MSAEQAAALLAGTKPGEDYQYLSNKFGDYELEIQALKFTKAGKPCFEAKVLSAKKTHENEPYAVGSVVSHVEDLTDEKKGGRARLMRALLSILHLTPAEISKIEVERDGKIRELEGDGAQRIWFLKMLDQVKCPTAFMRVRCAVEPRPADNGKVYSKERWSPVELTESDLDAIDVKRVAAKLPKIEDAMK